MYAQRDPVLNQDIPDHLLRRAMDAAKSAVQRNTQEKDMAQEVKRSMEQTKDDGLWSVVVGKQFGRLVK